MRVTVKLPRGTPLCRAPESAGLACVAGLAHTRRPCTHMQALPTPILDSRSTGAQGATEWLACVCVRTPRVGDLDRAEGNSRRAGQSPLSYDLDTAHF